MRSRLRHLRVPRTALIGTGAVAWLAAITTLHLVFNTGGTSRRTVRMGYMPVVANLACPLLDAASKEGHGVRFEAMKFASFAEMGEALRNGSIDAGFMIAPLSIVLHQQGADVKVVYIGNRHESTLVVRSDLPARDFGDLAGRTLAVPVRYSGHYICARQLQERYGAAGARVRIVEMNPPDMPSAMATGALDAYFVGEPFALRSVQTGKGRVLLDVEQVWPGFICNLLVVPQALIDREPATVQQLVHGAARSGLWARDHRRAAAEVVSGYWGQDRSFVSLALDTLEDRIVWDRFVPRSEEMQQLADQMVRFGLLERAETPGLVDDRFARSARLDGVDDLASILDPDPGAPVE